MQLMAAGKTPTIPPHMPPLTTLGERVKFLREGRDMSQNDLARRVGVVQQSIDALERGVVSKPRYIVSLARALSVDAEWLEDGVGPTPAVERLPQSDAGSVISSENFAGMVPILETAEAPDGCMLMFPSARLGLTRRPPQLNGS